MATSAEKKGEGAKGDDPETPPALLLDQPLPSALAPLQASIMREMEAIIRGVCADADPRCKLKLLLNFVYV